MNRSITPATLAVAVLAATLAGCGNRGGGSQVVAKVGESEITVSQLSQALHARGLDNAGATATREAVDSLINEQILVDSATNNKLDRDPAVVQALERARRQVLARAYVERMVFPTEAISAAEQVEFYKKHPELFERRKMFQVTTFSVKAGDVTDDLRNVLAPLQSPDEIDKVLTTRGVSHDTSDCKVTIRHIPDVPGVAATLFRGLAKAGINIDVIVQNASQEGATDVSFTVARADAAQAEELVRAARGRMEANCATSPGPLCASAEEIRSLGY